jgi:hypothetical protein
LPPFIPSLPIATAFEPMPPFGKTSLRSVAIVSASAAGGWKLSVTGPAFAMPSIATAWLASRISW